MNGARGLLSMTCGLLALGASLAGAAPAPGEPLEPEKAFRVAASADAGGIDLRFRIEDGYYLYANRFRVEPDPALPVGTPQIPPGEVLDDPFIGRTQILRRSALVRLPFAGAVKPGTYRVAVTAQGCAEEKVCYAPFRQVVRVTVPPAP